MILRRILTAIPARAAQLCAGIAQIAPNNGGTNPGISLFAFSFI
jgi:hypothetical protein